jgi:hypothetical protein
VRLGFADVLRPFQTDLKNPSVGIPKSLDLAYPAGLTWVIFWFDMRPSHTHAGIGAKIF